MSSLIVCPIKVAVRGVYLRRAAAERIGFEPEPCKLVIVILDHIRRVSAKLDGQGQIIP